MNSKETTTKINKATIQQLPVEHRKLSGGMVTYMIASLIALWLAEAFFGHPYNFREIEI